MLISIVPKPNKINFVFLQFCHDQVIFYQDLLLLLMVMFLFLLILGLKFGLNRINDRWNIVVIVGLVVVVIVVVDPRNLPLKLCQNWGSNCYDIVVFVVAAIFVIHLKFGQNCVSDRWNIAVVLAVVVVIVVNYPWIIFISNPTFVMLGWVVIALGLWQKFICICVCWHQKLTLSLLFWGS